ncbi:MAG: hypothetical protein AAF982_09770 [Pseudomonadota bacterium]
MAEIKHRGTAVSIDLGNDETLGPPFPRYRFPILRRTVEARAGGGA